MSSISSGSIASPELCNHSSQNHVLSSDEPARRGLMITNGGCCDCTHLICVYRNYVCFARRYISFCLYALIVSHLCTEAKFSYLYPLLLLASADSQSRGCSKWYMYSVPYDDNYPTSFPFYDTNTTITSIQ